MFELLQLAESIGRTEKLKSSPFLTSIWLWERGVSPLDTISAIRPPETRFGWRARSIRKIEKVWRLLSDNPILQFPRSIDPQIPDRKVRNESNDLSSRDHQKGYKTFQ
jgi:hypothetical protein